MRRFSVADAKARLSAVLAEVEAGEQVINTRRGRAVARIIPEPAAPTSDFSLDELFAYLDQQPMYSGNGAEDLRALERY